MRLRPDRNPIRFSFAVAAVWALVVGLVATVGRLFGPEDERGSWGEVLGAIAGNFAVVLGLGLVISVVLWSSQRRARG